MSSTYDPVVAPHCYGTLPAAESAAAIMADAFGHHLRSWNRQPPTRPLRSVGACALCARVVQVHEYEEGGCIRFMLSGAALEAFCPWRPEIARYSEAMLGITPPTAVEWLEPPRLRSAQVRPVAAGFVVVLL
jgi:hypothetical protein